MTRRVIQLETAKSGDYAAVPDAARLLNYSVATVWTYLQTGKLTTYKFMAHTLVSREEITERLTKA